MKKDKNKLYIPDVFQENSYNCGVTCVQAILAYYGDDYTEDELSKHLSVDEKIGTTIQSIINFFKTENFKVRYGKFNLNNVKKAIDKKIPIIALIQSWKENNDIYSETIDWGHYVIISGYNDKKQILYIEDPAIFGLGYLKYSELNERWHGANDNDKNIKYFGIIISGKKPYNYKKLIHLENKMKLLDQIQKIQEQYNINMIRASKRAKKRSFNCSRINKIIIKI